MKEETCYGSAIRNEYLKIINANRRAEDWPNPENKIKEEYYVKN